MKLTITILMLLFIAGPGYGWKFAEDWSTQDTVLQGAFTIVTIIDWGQTRHIATHPDEFYETNKFLGKHPSLKKINIYFIGYIMGNSGISTILWGSYRTIWQSFYFGMETNAIFKNYSIGIKTKF